MLRQDYLRSRLVARDFELLIVFGVFSLSPLYMNILAAVRAHALRVGPSAQHSLAL